MKESKILLVDDDELVLTRIETILKSEGHKVTTAKSGEKAIKLLEKNTFALVITDLVMENVDGFAVVKKAKELSPETTTMVLTGYKTTDFVIDAFKIGVDDYLIKPSYTDDILFSVRRCFEKRKANKERRQAEEALRESEGRYRILAERNPHGIQVIDPTGIITYVNPAYQEMLGYTKEELLGKHIVDLLEPASKRPELREYLSLLVKEQPEPTTYFQNNRRKDGEVIEVAVSWNYSKDSEGNVVGFIFVITDITERKRADEKLRQSEEKYRDIFQNSLVSLWEEDISELRSTIDDLKSQGIKDFRKYMDEHLELAMQATEMIKVVDVNDATLKLYGAKEKEELLGSLDNIATQDSLSVFKEEIIAIAEGQRYIQTEVAGQTLQGERLDLLITMSIPPEKEEYKNMLVSIMDITSRKRTEEALRASERQLTETVTATHTGYYEIDIESGKAIWSDETYRIFGIDAGDKPPTIQTYSKLVHEEDRSKVYDIYSECIKENKTFDLTYRILTVQGETRFVHSIGKVKSDSDGRAIKLIGTFQDVTEQKRAEESLRASEDQLRQAQKLESIGRLAGGLAHDFNNLLTTIIGYSELISMEEDLNDTTKEGVQEIKNSAERAAALTQQLLAFSRKQVLKPHVIDLNLLITKLGSMLKRLVSEDINLTTELGSNLGNIKADPGQVEQVIMNLVVNARDAMPEGGAITIETLGVNLDESYHQQHPEVIPGDYVLLAVSDTGHGMDEETQSQVFEPFFTTKEVGKGTGLGLSTVYGIVKQSGGFIWVYSKLEQGTTFKIYLPQITGTKKQHESRPQKKDPMGGTETILLVEDEESLRKMAGKILKGYGYCVIEADDGMDALEIVNKKDYPEIDLLVTDVIMPKMGGKELSEKLFEEYPKLKVVYISGYTDNAIAHHGVLDEGVSLLQKPFSSESLAEKVREILDED